MLSYPRAMLNCMTIRSFSGTHDWHPSVLNDTDAHEAGNADKIIWNIEHGFCPRCERPLPKPPEYPAGSRITRCRSIPICGDCGSDEAHQAMEGSGYSSAGSWPLPAEEIEERHTRFRRSRRPGKLTMIDGQLTLIMEDGTTIPVDPPDTGGWAQYGISDD